MFSVGQFRFETHISEDSSRPVHLRKMRWNTGPKAIGRTAKNVAWSVCKCFFVSSPSCVVTPFNHLKTSQRMSIKHFLQDAIPSCGHFANSVLHQAWEFAPTMCMVAKIQEKYINKRTYPYLYLYIYIYICMYGMYVCMYVCIYIYIYVNNLKRLYKK